MKLKDHKVVLIKNDGLPIVSQKINRNSPCRCGSGKKAKNCHGAETTFYTTKPKEG